MSIETVTLKRRTKLKPGDVLRNIHGQDLGIVKVKRRRHHVDMVVFMSHELLPAWRGREFRLYHFRFPYGEAIHISRD